MGSLPQRSLPGYSLRWTITTSLRISLHWASENVAVLFNSIAFRTFCLMGNNHMVEIGSFQHFRFQKLFHIYRFTPKGPTIVQKLEYILAGWTFISYYSQFREIPLNCLPISIHLVLKKNFQRKRKFSRVVFFLLFRCVVTKDVVMDILFFILHLYFLVLITSHFH